MFAPVATLLDIKFDCLGSQLLFLRTYLLFSVATAAAAAMKVCEATRCRS